MRAAECCCGACAVNLMVCALQCGSELLGSVVFDSNVDWRPPSLQNLLKLDGKLITVGVPPHPLQLPTNALIFGRKSVAGSLIGGIKETQEMLNFCGEHNITSDVSPPGACTPMLVQCIPCAVLFVSCPNQVANHCRTAYRSRSAPRAM